MSILKTKNKLISIAILLIVTAMTTTVNAQNITGASTNNYVLKFTNTSLTVPTAGNSLIFDDGTNVGIGYGGAGSYKLDVDGHVHIPAANAYYIGTVPFLWDNNITTSLFVGYNTGHLGSNNTFMGSTAGLTSGGYNDTYIGSGSGATCGGGEEYQNTAVGVNSLYGTEAYGGCALGYFAGYYNTTGCSLIAVGEHAAEGNTSGSRNSVIGHRAALGTQTGTDNAVFGDLAGNGDYTPSNYSYSDNCIFGSSAGFSLKTDSDNVFIGYKSAYSNTYASENVAVGYKSLYMQSYNGGSTPALWNSYNTAIGDEALYSNQPTATSNGIDNAALGHQALYSNTVGAYNTASGYQAGYENQTGDYNTASGYQAGYGTASTNNSGNAYFGYWAGYKSGTVTGGSNVCIGIEAGQNNATSYATFVGSDAGQLNTSGLYNTYVGFDVGGSNLTGQYNCFVGLDAGYYNTSNYNSGLGTYVLFKNTSGTENTGVGTQALYNDTSGSQNTAEGYEAAYSNTTGGSNTSLGFEAAYNGTTGSYNTIVGFEAGYDNTTDSQNTALGYKASYNNTTGSYNTSSGYEAGYTITTGDSDTFVGAFADANANNYNNCAAFGYGAKATASDQITIGNLNVTSIGGYASWTKYSDGRFKINVQNENIGLDFINKLRPITYQLDTKALNTFINPNVQQQQPQVEQHTDSSGNIVTSVISFPPPPPAGDFSASTSIVHSGFIAQEVDSVSKALGFTSSIVHEPANSNDPYGLDYAQFVVPLVRAVQQLDSTNKAIAAKMQTQDSVINALQGQISQCCAQSNPDSPERNSGMNNNNGGAKQESVQQLELGSLSNSIILYQNEPNPFGDNTTIRYYVPDNIQNVVIVFYDEYGREINRAQVVQNGYGSIQISSSNLANGIYSYSMMANGQVVDTKRMLRSK